MFSKVLVYGMGLMGGSLALSIRNLYPNSRITAVVRKKQTKDSILAKKLADYVYLGDELPIKRFAEFDLVVFATPVGNFLKFLEDLPVDSDTIYIDLGSTKKSILEILNKQPNQNKYISCHPMCGSEQAGAVFAIPDLYSGKLCILTKTEFTDSLSYEKVKAFWEAVGSWTLDLDAEIHDQTLAYLSHLPHFISTILVNTAIDNDITMKVVDAAEKPITGGGFRDMARIAGSNPEMWFSIFLENQVFCKEALISFRSQLDTWISWMESDLQENKSTFDNLWSKAYTAKNRIQKTDSTS